MALKNQHKVEFGDFQTPLDLARDVCSVISQKGFQPASILEPTCGAGVFIQAALEYFDKVKQVIGFDVNPVYVEKAKIRMLRIQSDADIHIDNSDFFVNQWEKIIESFPKPLLILGNPPWVTNAEIGKIGGNNLPGKSNFESLKGIEALTGKSNFDISEHMIRKNCEWLNNSNGMLAVLCKTTVARKILQFIWKRKITIKSVSMYSFDSIRYFNVSVDACLLNILFEPNSLTKECEYYDSLKLKTPNRIICYKDSRLIANITTYDKWSRFLKNGLGGWRSGVKHDCSKVFELRRRKDKYYNGFNIEVDVEDDFIFPLIKGSDIAAKREPNRFILIHQKSLSDNPKLLEITAPKVWRYLNSYSKHLDKRASSIYRKKPRFSIFGIGSYTFAPYKIAIAGLYKKLEFVKIPPFQNKPVALDDTCYLFPCWSENECDILYRLVSCKPVIELLSSLIFWDSKRPITSSLLNNVNLAAIAQFLSIDSSITDLLSEYQSNRYHTNKKQIQLL